MRRVIDGIFFVAILIVLSWNVLAFRNIDVKTGCDVVDQKLSSHIELDNERFSRLLAVDASADKAVQRLTAVEEGLKSTNNRIDEMIWWLRACFGALITQLIGALVRFIPAFNRRVR